MRQRVVGAKTDWLVLRVVEVGVGGQKTTTTPRFQEIFLGLGLTSMAGAVGAVIGPGTCPPPFAAFESFLRVRPSHGRRAWVDEMLAYSRIKWPKEV